MDLLQDMTVEYEYVIAGCSALIADYYQLIAGYGALTARCS